ncbi:hypothetical protein EDM00_05045 [Ornithobacterium rhinotracheale]|uniref:IdeS/Mac family cysteine endopeptidase n=1 Tax=Ornithobacterium rhinotracheale TaxID=28251 RepID=UPI00129CF1BD|nr:IdeS/Mac family cysteine endopeptidase [Ornithobacterium rhinotracheale]MRI63354.1 hypothetical protein [Ornithobacterium rhinotracheale]
MKKLFLIVVILSILTACSDEGEKAPQKIKNNETTKVEKPGKEDDKPKDKPKDPPNQPVAQGAWDLQPSNFELNGGRRMSLFVSDEASSEVEKHQIEYNDAWKADFKSVGNLVALYPAIQPYDINQNEYILKAQEEQSTREFLSYADLRVAKTKVSNSKKITLDFKHLLCKVNLILKSETLSSEQLNHLKVSINSLVSAKINLKSGEIGAYPRYEFREISACPMGNATYSAWLIPQSKSNFRPGTQNSFVIINVNGVEYRFSSSIIPDDKDFVSGGEINITLQLKTNEYSNYANTTKWVYGVSTPPESAWVMSEYYPQFENVPWQNGYNWFDCKKTYSLVSSDINMCWAASASSLIHWWMKQNSQYLKQINYQGPQKFIDPLHSEVFDFYKKNYHDAGGFTDAAIRQFMVGITNEKGKVEGGFFREILKGSTFVETVNVLGGADNRKTFNQKIIEAMSQKKGIEFQTLDHSMCLWGAEFNSQGIISAIYYTDNNDGALRFKRIPGLKKIKIKYENNQITAEPGNNVEINGTLKALINRLTFLDKADAQWEKYLSGKRS